MPGFWDRLWKRRQEFIESGEESYRHNTPFVAVSSIAEQFYCEYKLENEHAMGEVPTEAKELGTSLHDELMPTEEVTKEEFARLVGGKRPSLATLNLWGSAGGLKIIGTPDHIIWSEGKPIWVVELKTTKSDPATLWEDQENQLRIYGLLLDRMGFDCSKMRLALVRLRSDGLSEQDKVSWMPKVAIALMEDRTSELEKAQRGTVKVHLLTHDPRRAERAITSKAGYWRMEREPEASNSAGKCRACEYNAVCPKSLAKDSDKREGPSSW